MASATVIAPVGDLLRPLRPLRASRRPLGGPWHADHRTSTTHAAHITCTHAYILTHDFVASKPERIPEPTKESIKNGIRNLQECISDDMIQLQL